MTNPTNTPASLVSVVDEVLYQQQVRVSKYESENGSILSMPDDLLALTDITRQALLAAFEEVANRVIGPDQNISIEEIDQFGVPHKLDKELFTQYQVMQNQLRVSQRKTLQKELGK